jgi:hypothetical protein
MEQLVVCQGWISRQAWECKVKSLFKGPLAPTPIGVIIVLELT